MIIPIRCFTCGKPIATWEDYLKEFQKIIIKKFQKEIKFIH